MKTIKWKPGLRLPLDPDDIEDYEFDFTEWLDGDALDAVEVNADGVTVSNVQSAGNVASFRLAAAVIGTATVTVRATADSGRRADRTLIFKVTER